ncbi:MAG: hypothetical protein IJG84_03435 [Kiritimatiellae bacterium]|nr:hypothetical protein [Kiritimatiellia bacterium]
MTREINDRSAVAGVIIIMRHGTIPQHHHDRELLRYYADLIDAAEKCDAASIERAVRDAIIDYQEMYVHAPNDDAECELVERAKRGNDWLVAHGYEPEPVNFGKEEIPCL